MDEASTMNELQTMDLQDTIAIDQVKYSFLISHLVIHALVYGLARHACLIFGVYVWFRTGSMYKYLMYQTHRRTSEFTIWISYR